MDLEESLQLLQELTRRATGTGSHVAWPLQHRFGPLELGFSSLRTVASRRVHL